MVQATGFFVAQTGKWPWLDFYVAPTHDHYADLTVHTNLLLNRVFLSNAAVAA
jgi:hypothetical protein